MKLFIFGETITSRLSDSIIKDYPDAMLITEDNYETKFNIGYSGIEEFYDKTKFLKLLFSVKEIFYISDNNATGDFDYRNPTMNMRGLTEYFLLIVKEEGIKINNFIPLGTQNVIEDLNVMLSLIDYRKPDNGPQLWCVGCSVTVGYGVDQTQRYSNLISKKLNLPLNLLAHHGSSIPWASDQILRSDIRNNDLVIWGITTKNRINYFHNGEIIHLHPLTINHPSRRSLSDVSKHLLTDEDFLSYTNLTSIDRVVKFCKKIGAKLLLVGIMPTDSDFLFLRKFQEYYHYPYPTQKFKDLGYDGGHPGPLQHQEYAEKILSLLEKRKFITQPKL
jgi:hypothetical protein